MKQVTIPAQWLQELIALCGPEDHELRERVMKSAAPAPVDALATGGQAQAVKLLAADHSGMKVDYRGLFSQVQRALKRTDPGYAEMLRQLEGHLQELGQRWYAGDTDVVDEILQLYCIERDARKTVGVTETAAPQAQADLYKAKADRYDFIVEKKLILSGGTEQFGWPIAPFGSECDRYIDAAIAAAKGLE